MVICSAEARKSDRWLLGFQTVGSAQQFLIRLDFWGDLRFALPLYVVVQLPYGTGVSRCFIHRRVSIRLASTAVAFGAVANNALIRQPLSAATMTLSQHAVNQINAFRHCVRTQECRSLRVYSRMISIAILSNFSVVRTGTLCVIH